MNSRKNRMRAVLGIAVFIATNAASGTAECLADEPARVLILSAPEGRETGCTTPILRRILADAGGFDVSVSEVPKGISPRWISDFDLVIVNARGPLEADGEAAKALDDFVRSGKGLMVTHTGLGGANGPVTFLESEVARADHPIAVGLPARFKVADAPARIVPQAGDDVLLVAQPGKTPLMTALQSGAGRVVRMALGHDPAAMHEEPFVRAFARAARWAATGKVANTGDSESVKSRPRTIRGVVITGGHFHEAAFFNLFADMPELSYLPVEQADALRSDLRKKYDVVILYDFEREADDAMKANLRAFVEDGKGIVVLHHALLNFQHWDWWCNEVVGGSYRLSNEGGKPSSAVKDAQDFYLTPKGDHPITAGLAPFHLVDEAYRRMRFSDGITPLVTTDNPASDPTVAWVGPGASRRVVAIQLGHGQTAFRHPSYRTLVHNAILWAAGRTK